MHFFPFSYSYSPVAKNGHNLVLTQLPLSPTAHLGGQTAGRGASMDTFGPTNRRTRVIVRTVNVQTAAKDIQTKDMTGIGLELKICTVTDAL